VRGRLLFLDGGGAPRVSRSPVVGGVRGVLETGILS